MPKQVLVVENSARLRQQIATALAGAGFAVRTDSRLATARAVLHDVAQEFEVVVIEESIGGGKGLRLLQETRAQHAHLPVVMVTRKGNWQSHTAALSLGAVAYLPHPVNPERLVAAVEQAVSPPRKQNRNTQPRRWRTNG